MGEQTFYEEKRIFFGNKKCNSRSCFENLSIVPKQKRSQITLFIILGIALLAVIFLLFFRNTNFADFILGKNPVEQVESCMHEALTQGISLVEAQGGSVTPSLYYLYQDQK